MYFINRVPFLQNRIFSKGRRKLRRDLGASLRLKSTNRQHRVSAVKRALDKTPCMKKTGGSALLFGAAAERAEIVVRQYLLKTLIENKINRILINSLANNKAVVYPLPRRWINVLRQEGFPVAGFRSCILFVFFVLSRFGYGIVMVFKDLFAGIHNAVLKPTRPQGRYVFFDALSINNLPNGNNKTQYDIISWYEQWKDGVKGIKYFSTTVPSENRMAGYIPVVFTKNFIQPLYTADQLFRFFLWINCAVLLALADLFRGYYWSALMLGEAGKAAIVRIHKQTELGADYLFHNSFWIYRPLWTYDAEQRGAHITFYFYSTNIEPLKNGPNYSEPHVGWRTATWPHYLVWDHFQSDFVKRSVESEKKISIVGPISFSSGTDVMPTIPPNAVAVFDVQPMRDAFYNTLALSFDYYTPDQTNPFLSGIYETLNEYNLALVLKRKRNIGKKVHYRYRNLVDVLEKKKNFIAIDPDLPAELVIAHCRAVISMPFTSTALLGKIMGKPSVYYDATGVLQKSDRAAHGIEVLTGPDELREWLRQIVIA